MALELVLAKVSEMAAKSPAIDASIKFDLGGEIVHLDGKGTSNVVSTENKEADCTISMSSEDFQGMLSGSLNPMMAFMSGKIKIDGDMGVAMKLQSLFS